MSLFTSLIVTIVNIEIVSKFFINVIQYIFDYTANWLPITIVINPFVTNVVDRIT